MVLPLLLSKTYNKPAFVTGNYGGSGFPYVTVGQVNGFFLTTWFTVKIMTMHCRVTCSKNMFQVYVGIIVLLLGVVTMLKLRKGGELHLVQILFLI